MTGDISSMHSLASRSEIFYSDCDKNVDVVCDDVKNEVIERFRYKLSLSSIREKIHRAA